MVKLSASKRSELIAFCGKAVCQQTVGTHDVKAGGARAKHDRYSITADRNSRYTRRLIELGVLKGLKSLAFLYHTIYAFCYSFLVDSCVT